MGFSFKMIKKLKIIAESHQWMMGMYGQIAVIESSAITHAMALEIKGQARHEDKRRLIICDGSIENRFRNTTIAV